MAHTSGSDIAALLNEEGINKVFRYAKKQRPSLFNYGTKYFLESPARFCHLETAVDNVPFATEISTFRLPRSNQEVDLCFQLKDFKVDYSPHNIPLPPSIISQVLPDSFILSIDASAGFKFPGTENSSCVSFQVYAVLSIVKKIQIDGVVLTPNILAIEVVDIHPEVLENMTESFMVSLLKYSVFPYISFNTKELSFNVARDFNVSIALAGMEPNPVFADNLIKVFFNIKL